MTAPVELARVLVHDAGYRHAKRELELRRGEAQEEAKEARRGAEERMKIEEEESQRRWAELCSDDMPKGLADVLVVDSWRKAK